MGEHMSWDDDRIFFKPATEGEPMVLVPVRVLKELIGMSIQLLSVLEIYLPDEGNRLQVLADEAWVDWPSLEDDLIKWIGAAVSSDDVIFPCQFTRLANGNGWLAVNVEHLIDDYWWVECQPTLGDDDSGCWLLQVDDGPAAAVLRIEGSRSCLPYTSETSPRITHDD